MTIRFQVNDRKFIIKSSSMWQVELVEIKLITDEKSPKFNQETEIFLGYHHDECQALQRLTDIIVLTDEMITTFDQANQVRTLLFEKIKSIQEEITAAQFQRTLKSGRKKLEESEEE